MPAHVRFVIVLALLGTLLQAIVQEEQFDIKDAAPDTIHNIFLV